MKSVVPITRKTARQFIADWFGFDCRRVHISGYQTDKDGNCISVQFRVNSFARLRYLARRRTAEAEWELILLP